MDNSFSLVPRPIPSFSKRVTLKNWEWAWGRGYNSLLLQHHKFYQYMYCSYARRNKSKTNHRPWNNCWARIKLTTTQNNPVSLLSLLALSEEIVCFLSLSFKCQSQQSYIRYNIYSDTHISGMERAMITIFAPSGNSSQVLISYQIQNHCVKPCWSYGQKCHTV